MTVAELRRRMSHREFVEWIAFYSVEAKERERQAKKQEQQRRSRRRR